MELGLASSLTGDTSLDIATGQTLVKAFAMGMQQNMQNLLDVSFYPSFLAFSSSFPSFFLPFLS